MKYEVKGSLPKVGPFLKTIKNYKIMENEETLIEEPKMNVTPIYVPENIEYISEWKDFKYPMGHVILDKTICGCGFTEYCLNNDIPILLCSPRKRLLENKEEQHNSERGREKGLREVYYFKNEYDRTLGYDGGEDEITNTTNPEPETVNTPFGSISKLDELQIKENLDDVGDSAKEEYLKQIKNNLRSYIESCSEIYCRQHGESGKPFKIIVTYDSLHHVLDVLNEYYSSSSYAIVVDEFQSIFMDASFKATVELDFVSDLQNCTNVLYLSATPMLEKYLGMIDEFKDLPMYKFIWPSSRVENVRTELRIVPSIPKELKLLIERYRNGQYPDKVLSDGTVKYSKELVIFMNSITSICSIIKKNDLKPDEVNVICADSSKNIKKLKSVGHEIGRIPMEGEYHKMFTFCTRTSYLGADFYSTNAFTVVCSDCNIQTMTVDIVLDLPQILGRQRLRENVFRNEALILYHSETKKGAMINAQKLVNDEKVKGKERMTLDLLERYNKMDDYGKLIWGKVAKERDKSNLYKDDYIGVSSRTGEAKFNYLVMVADMRAWDVTRREYIDEITIKRGIESINSVNVEVIDGNIELELQQAYDHLLSEFNKDNNFVRRMKLLCDTYFQYPEFYTKYANSPLPCMIPIEYQNYINILGFEKIRAVGYIEIEILKEIETLNNLNTVDISSLFTVGEKYTKKYIKETLGEFYNTNKIHKTPKASDLDEYFILKSIKLKVLDKWENGFEIISKK